MQGITNQPTRGFLSSSGRLSRGAFVGRAVLAAGVFVVLFVFLEKAFGAAATWLLYPPLAWIALALSARRMHDRGRSAGWLLAALIPILGPLWLLVELALRGGTPGDNPYGDDPRLARADYLTVQ